MGIVACQGFGTLTDGTEALLYTLIGENGVQASFTDYGARLVSFIVPDNRGVLGDIALSCRDAPDLQTDGSSIGATIGRVAGRIGNSAFELDGVHYRLPANEGPHHLHGGSAGFGQRKWSCEIVEAPHPTICFTIVSPAGDGGYPGELTASLTCVLEPPAQLVMTFEATSTEATPFNPTSHGYFNLDGHDAGSIEEHNLTIFADRYTVVGEDLIPTGEIRDVEGTPFDFCDERQIGAFFDDLPTGYDQNFIIRPGPGPLRIAARANSARSGRIMTVWTDRPCIHLYTGHFLNVPEAKDAARYSSASGFALETQGYPDAMNHEAFQADILRAGEVFRSQTIFEFRSDNQP